MNETPDQDTIFDRLDGLLDRERHALITGDLRAIEPLLEEKEALLNQIAAQNGPARPQIEALQGKALRNQALLDSALRGIRNVASRFATLRRIRKTLETYDEFGQKTALPAAQDRKVERRA